MAKKKQVRRKPDLVLTKTTIQIETGLLEYGDMMDKINKTVIKAEKELWDNCQLSTVTHAKYRKHYYYKVIVSRK